MHSIISIVLIGNYTHMHARQPYLNFVCVEPSQRMVLYKVQLIAYNVCLHTVAYQRSHEQ